MATMSTEFSPGVGRTTPSPRRESATRLRRTVYLTIILVTLTTALYTLRGVSKPEVEGILDDHVPKSPRNLQPDGALHVRSSRQTDQEVEPKSKQKNGANDDKLMIRKATSVSPSAAGGTKESKLSSIGSPSASSPSPMAAKTTASPAIVDQFLGFLFPDTSHAKMSTPTTATPTPSVTTSKTPKNSNRKKQTAQKTSSEAPSSSTTFSSLSTDASPTSTTRTSEAASGVAETTTTTYPTSATTSSHKAHHTESDSTTTGIPTDEFCEQPAYHEFPADVFTNKQRADGAVIIHIIIGVYMFYALAVVCDEYFVASMEKICQAMGLSEDIAGATFMAAGSSAPELFASLLGVFVAKGDVGTGTIVGSAVFNVLFVIGLCAFFCERTLPLNWWPLFRDSSYYAFTVIVLVIVLADGYVTWMESVIMLILYAVYIVLMKYNVKLRIWLTENTRFRMMDELTKCSQGILKYDDKQIRSSYVQFTNDAIAVDDDAMSSWKNDDPSQLDVDEIIRDYPRKKVTLYEAALMVMMSRYFRSLTRFRCASLRIIVERRRIQIEGIPHKSITIGESHYPNPLLISREMTKDSREAWKKAPTVEEQGLLAVITWFVTIPVLATLYYTIPDCRNARWERYFILTFLTAIIWIAFFSYILVWMVTLVGYTLGIPDTIMGITFLAAGTSVPDAYASLIVAKQGLGDMAVANSLGSNVFDILIGLALPWFLKTFVFDPNSTVRIRSSGMVYNVILLFLSIFATIFAVHHCRWQLDKRLGVILLVCYAVFLFFAILIECNVFGFVNYPECEE